MEKKVPGAPDPALPGVRPLKWGAATPLGKGMSVSALYVWYLRAGLSKCMLEGRCECYRL